MNTTLLDGVDGYKLRGRKLILHWGKLKLEISKLPYGDGPKDPVFDLCGSDVLLADVYEGPDGHIVDEILGPPAGHDGTGKNIEGRDIHAYLCDDEYWRTPGETL